MKRENKIEKEAALEIIRDWADYFNEPFDDDTMMDSSLLKAVMEGRADLDQDKEEFSLELRKPITLENGETLSSIKVKDPGASYLLDKQKVMQKGKIMEMELDVTASQMTLSTDLALGVLRRMSTHDVNTINNMLAFFR